MARIYILEQETWLTAGLRRFFPEGASATGEASGFTILHRNRKSDFQALTESEPADLYLLDLSSLPEEAVHTLRFLLSRRLELKTIVLLDREQRSLMAEFLQLGCLAYLEKATPVVQIGQMCQRILEKGE